MANAAPGQIAVLHLCEVCGWCGSAASCPFCNGDRGLVVFVRESYRQSSVRDALLVASADVARAAKKKRGTVACRAMLEAAAIVEPKEPR